MWFFACAPSGPPRFASAPSATDHAWPFFSSRTMYRYPCRPFVARPGLSRLGGAHGISPFAALLRPSGQRTLPFAVAPRVVRIVVALDLFSSRDWPAFESIDKTHTDLDQSRTMMRGSWDLPPLASRAAPPRLRSASRCCPGISLFQVFQAPIGAFVQARPRTDHQSPATASGPVSAHGFYAWIAGKSWLRAERPDNNSSADPSAY